MGLLAAALQVLYRIPCGTDTDVGITIILLKVWQCRER